MSGSIVPNGGGAGVPSPNDPLAYPPSPAVLAVSPIINQITGGAGAPTAAAVGQSVKTDNGLFSGIIDSVQKVSSQLSAAFTAGKSAGSGNAQDIANQVNELGNQKAKAILDSGSAGALAVLGAGLQKAAAANAIATDTTRLGLNPNDPNAIANMKAINDSAAIVGKNINDVNQMKSVGFFDNPAEYLINHVINIPLAEGRAQDALADSKTVAYTISAQTQALQGRSVADTALNSVDTTTRAALLYKQTLAAATAAGIEPLTQAKQIEISAYDLSTAQARVGIEAQQLGIQQQLLPGKLRQQDAIAKFYEINKIADVQQLNARAQLENQHTLDAVAKNTQDAASLASVNHLLGSFGMPPTVTDFSKIKNTQSDALIKMASNFDATGQIAGDPAAARDLLLRGNIALNKLPAGQFPTLNGIDSYYKEAEVKLTTKQPLGPPPLKGQDLDYAIRSEVFKKIQDEQNNMSGSNRIFAIPSVASSVSRYSDSNPIIAAMKPLTMDGSGAPINRPMDGSLLMNTAADLVSSGKLSIADATKYLTAYAHSTLGDMQTAGGFKRFAIPLQQKFPMLFSKSGFNLGSSMTHIDLYNSADVLSKLRAQVAGLKYDRASALTEGGLP